MVRSIPRSLFWLAWALAVVWLSLIAAPRRVSGQETPTAVRTYFSPRRVAQAPVPVPVDAASFEATTSDPAPPVLSEPFSEQPAGPPFPTAIESPAAIGTAQAPHYWIVSSRCDVQHRRELHLDDGDLDVYQRTPDGQLSQTNLATLQSQLIPGIPVLMCVHGSFVTWEDECLESHAAYQWVRHACPELPIQVIFFTWPSHGMITGLLPTDVAIRGKQAEFNGFHVARLLNCVPESCPVSFIGHSLGCRVILSTLHLAGGGEVQGYAFPGAMTAHRYRAVFAAAAVDHHWMNPHDRYGCALPRAECIVNLRNRKDFALAFYPLHRPFAGRALARSGLTRRDTRKLGPLSDKLINVDVTEIEGHNHLWPGYFQSPEIAAAIAPVIYYPETNQPLGTPPVYEMPAAPPVEQMEYQQAPLPAVTPQPTLVAPEATEPTPPSNAAPVYNPPADDFNPITPLLAPSVP